MSRSRLEIWWRIWWPLHHEKRYLHTRRAAAATVFFAVWGVYVLYAQATGQYITAPDLSVFQFLERNAWPLFTAIVFSTGAYWRMSLRSDVHERDIGELKRSKADAALMHEQIGALKEGMAAIQSEVKGLRDDIAKTLVNAIADAIARNSHRL